MLKKSHSIFFLSYLPNSVLFILAEKVTNNLNFTNVTECVPIYILEYSDALYHGVKA
jgi:hypothetical protein